MTHDDASKRAAALVHQAIDVLQRAENAPDSPVNTFLPAKERRKFRRAAARLRLGKAEPRYKNLHTAEQLAEIYERTVQRDEILEQAFGDFKRITLDLGRALEECGPEVATTLDTLIAEAKRSAEEHGPGSETAQRYRLLQLLGWFGQEAHSHIRRQRAPAPRYVPLARDRSVEEHNRMCAAELLPSPPSAGEAVIAIPAECGDSERGRIFLRIGTGEASCIGSFERGPAEVSTVCMLPDGKHLFVSADGAGYVIDAKSRTLVEKVGKDVVGVWRDAPLTMFVVNHDDMRLEAFGRTGRLWKTDAIGAGGFRRMAIADHELIGEVQHPSRPAWVPFSVKLATGEVKLVGLRTED